nr:hypothetical protein [Tanacetum cinerariifolium]
MLVAIELLEMVELDTVFDYCCMKEVGYRHLPAKQVVLGIVVAFLELLYCSDKPTPLGLKMIHKLHVDLHSLIVVDESVDVKWKSKKYANRFDVTVITLQFRMFKVYNLKVMLEIIKDVLANNLEETNDCEDLQLQATTNFKADNVDAYDSECDDEATADAIFMENLSPVGSLNDDTVAPRYDSNILFEELLVNVSASFPFTQSGNEKWAHATSHKRNNKPYVDASRTKQTIKTITKEHAVKQNTRKTDNTMLPSTGRSNGSKFESQKIYLGDDVIVISSNKIEGSGDWSSLEYQDTTGSKGKKVMNALSFYKMETDEVNYKVKKGQKLVKKELIVARKGELYFVTFIINPKEDDVEPGVILGRSFMRLAKGIVDFELPPLVCKIGKSNRSKKRSMENLSSFYQDIGPFLLAGDHLTQEEAAKEALMWKDKVELDGKIVKEEEETIKRIKGEALKEKDDPRAFIFSIRLEGKVNENTLADTGLDSNIMPYRIYKILGREEMKKIKRNKFGAPIYGLKLAPYMNCNDPADRSLALQAVTNPFRKISVWKKAVNFLGSLPVPLKQVNWKPNYKGCYTKEKEATGQ